MFISNRIKERCKIDYHVFILFFIFIHCELYFYTCVSGSSGEKKAKSFHFPVKLIRFFVRSISCRRRASPGTVPTRLHSRGLPVINFTSLKSQDFRSAGYFFFSFHRSNKTNIIQTWMKAIPEGVKLWKMKTYIIHNRTMNGGEQPHVTINTQINLFY